MYSPGTLFDGRYLLKEQKGRGSFGEVWLATDQQVGVDFAIKIYVAMSSQGLQDFRKEYQLSCNLINSNLLHANFMGICQENSCPYLVMPFCPCGTSSMIGNVDEHTLWKFLHDVANGLSYLHNQNPPIVHQDIKPDNILQSQNGDFVITDFGISKQMRATLNSTANNTSGALAYMGPERFSGDYQTIKASDIWSLGATLYELATGRLPFEGRGGSLLNAGAELPNLPDTFSQEINQVMRSCMAKEPWERPSSSQLADMAESVLKGRPISVVNTTTSSIVENPSTPDSEDSVPEESSVSTSESKSRNLIYIICGVVAVALIGFIGYMLFGSNDSPSSANSPVVVQEITSSEPDIEESQPVISVPNPVDEDPVIDTSPSEVDKVSETKTEKKVQEKPAPTGDVVSSGTVNLGYASWTGGLKNGKPHGQGTMTFSRDYDLQGHSVKVGDTVKGDCDNGKLTGYCKWHSASGDKSILLGE